MNQKSTTSRVRSSSRKTRNTISVDLGYRSPVQPHQGPLVILLCEVQDRGLVRDHERRTLGTLITYYRRDSGSRLTLSVLRWTYFLSRPTPEHDQHRKKKSSIGKLKEILSDRESENLGTYHQVKTTEEISETPLKT